MAFHRFPLTRKQFKAAISRANRSRLGSSSTGAALENLSKLLQVVAIFVGGAWVLLDYLEFKRSNNELLLQQGQLAVTTARINEDLNKLKLAHSTEGRLEVSMESSVVRSVRFDDGTYKHRYYISLKAKNISESTIFIPAVVVEFFVGHMPKDELSPDEALYVNLPPQWLQDPVAGKLSWVRKEVYAQSQFESPADESLKDVIQGFPALNVGVGGDLRSGAKTEMGMSFIIRSRPDAVVASVVTFWDRTGNSEHHMMVFKNFELLPEAQEATSLKERPSDSNASLGASKPSQ